MGNQYIHVGSVTNAMRGKSILEKQGIRAFVHRSVHPPKDEGCGYSLLITGRSAEAVGILRNAGVRVLKVSDAM